MDADGAPRAAASLSSMDGGKMDTACFMDAEINIASGGGCAVIVADFKPHAYNSLQKALKLKGQQVLIVTPYALEGKVSLAYSNLVYSCCYPYGKGKRLLLAFDNTQTLPQICILRCFEQKPLSCHRINFYSLWCTCNDFND